MNAQNLISTAALARRLDVPMSKLVRVLRRGGIQPNLVVTPKLHLFEAGRLDDIKALLGGDQ